METSVRTRLLLTCLLTCHVVVIHGKSAGNVHHVPSNAHTGHVVTVLPMVAGQRSWIHGDGRNMFTILRQGELITTSSLASKDGSLITLTVQHTEGPNEWKDVLVIHVEGSDRDIQFAGQPYKGYVSENQPPGTTVQQLSQLAKNVAKLPYGCTVNIVTGEQSTFAAGPTGNSIYEILTKAVLDRELVEIYHLVLEAKCPTGVAHAMVKISVRDVNDNAPTFPKTLYSTKVPIDLARAAPLLQIKARDLDKEDSIHYELEENDLFDIEAETGLIRLKSAGKLQLKSYELQAVAEDQAGQQARVDVRLQGSPPEEDESEEEDEEQLTYMHTVQRVKRAAQREERTYPIRREKEGALITVAEDDDSERYQFNDPAPEGLSIGTDTGIISRDVGYDWSNETEIFFSVNITRVGDPEWQDEQVGTIVLMDRTFFQLLFTNEPWPIVLRIPVWIRPGTVLTTLQSIDGDVSPDVDVQFKLESGADGKFDVNLETGDLYIVGRQQFEVGAQYKLAVSAIPYGVLEPPVSTPVQVIRVQVDDIPPQFFESPRYLVDMPETTQTNGVVVQIKVESFQILPVTFSMEPLDGGTSNIFSMDSSTGEIRLLQNLVHIEETIKQYRFVVTATESTSGHVSETDVVINLDGENLHAPYFPSTVYVKHDVLETIAVGQTILEASATDLDQGRNGLLSFDVSDDHFRVETESDPNTAIIKVNRQLDYDWLPDRHYSFTLTARDRGETPRTGTTTIQVWMVNVNNEPAHFEPLQQVTKVKDTCPSGELIHVVQAVDPDGGDVNFLFDMEGGPSNTYDIFDIDNDGHITLNSGVTKGRENLNLTIQATDSSAGLTSYGYVIVEFIGINTPPRFTECSSYAPRVPELEPAGYSVLNFSAVDDDSGANGEIDYSLVWSPAEGKQLFEVHEHGEGLGAELYTLIEFDRESPEPQAVVIGTSVKYKATIQATDRGMPPLSTTCFFFVEIEDVNDNAPIFDRFPYVGRILDSLTTNSRVLRVYAIDDDEDENARVSYHIVDDGGCTGCFSIGTDVGWLTKTGAVTSDVTLSVEGRDHGPVGAPHPGWMQVAVTIQVTNDADTLPPVWSYNGQDIDDITTVRLDENSTQLTPLEVRPLATGTGNALHLHLQRGRTDYENKDGDFTYTILTDPADTMEIRVSKLDYETTPWYSLRLTASYSNDVPTDVQTDARLYVDINDVNDNIPIFDGLNLAGKYPAAVTTETNIDDEVVQVTAIDHDATAPNNDVFYSFSSDCGEPCTKFAIDTDTGVVTAQQSGYDPINDGNALTLNVRVEDGAPSALNPSGLPNEKYIIVTIDVIGSTEDPPHFEHTSHQAYLDEALPYNTTVTTITAINPDPEMNVAQYHIVSGNDNDAFGVDILDGRIFVMSELLYADKTMYNLTYRVFDGQYSDYAYVVIDMVERNLKPPVFGEELYESIDQLEELDDQETYPFPLVTVAADDPGGGDVTYDIEGPHVNHFDIDQTGLVSMLGPLDRDYPQGFDPWTFTVTAEDDYGTDSKIGYSRVNLVLVDKNDHAPAFDICCVEGLAPENTPNDNFLQLVATDVDKGSNGQVTYEEVEIPEDGGSPIFSLNPTTGWISTTGAPAGNLDRETRDNYTMIVRAHDQGNPSNPSLDQTIWIRVGDENDNPPIFLVNTYEYDMDEAQPVGSSVAMLSAQDEDIGENAHHTYTVLTGPNSDHFYMDSLFLAETGVVKILQVVDYDATQQDQMTINVEACDTDWCDTAIITFNVRDVNDNAPVFVPDYVEVALAEDVPVGSLVATFTATDADSDPINNQFEYSVDYENSDDTKRFEIDATTGVVTLRNELDYETTVNYTVIILAIDTGTPAQTGTATLQVNVTDINDNAPELREEYNFQVDGDTSNGDVIATFYAKDLDSFENGPPFYFEDECNDPEWCTEFSFEFTADSSNAGDDVGVLRANLDGYSRGELGRKTYEYPILMRDNPQSGQQSMEQTIQVTVTIKSFNDNPHEPGHKDIVVYNYMREFEDVEIGHVFVEDEDDWDLHEKTFSFEGYHDGFKFSEDNPWMIVMERGVPQGVHDLEVSVSDDIHGTVVSSVKVNIVYIEAEEVANSGSMRLEGLTSHEFITRQKDVEGVYQPSKWELMRTELAELLETDVNNVHMFTVRDVPNEHYFDVTPRVDVMFAAHGSPWYRQSRLNGVVWNNKAQIETNVGVTIQLSPIELCMHKICYSGGCNNQLQTTLDPKEVFSNSTSFVGVDAMYNPVCECGPRTFSPEPGSCQPNPCLNSGECTETWNGYTCSCPEGFDGPRCQMLKHSFQGDGWGWVEPLAPCEGGKTSMEFITRQSNALLLYNGPMYEADATSFSDFMSVELVDGYPRLRVDLGQGMLTLTVDGVDDNGQTTLSPLNDGTWHSVDIFKDSMEFRLVVDHCKVAKVNEDIDNSTADRTACEAKGLAPGDDVLLNVFTPLELGGRANTGINFPPGLVDTQFSGCIKELVHNGMLYDLELDETGESSGTTANGCPDELGCDSCPINSTCVGDLDGNNVQCICHPGCTGPDCDEETTVKDFQETESYIEWDIESNFNNTDANAYVSELQMMFRTRQDSGMLYTIASFSTLEHLQLEIVDTVLTCHYDLGADNGELSLPYVNVSDGLWHVVRVSRHGNQVVLRLDGGEGKYYAESLPDDAHRLIYIRESFGAAELYYPNQWHTSPQVSKDLIETCLTDVRYEDALFPLDVTDASNGEAASVRNIEGAVWDCNSNACDNVFCPEPQFCEDYWKVPQCVCPYGQMVDPVAICVDIMDCSIARCVHGDCVTVPDDGGDLVWRCNCWDGYAGVTCEEPYTAYAAVATLSTGAMVAILVCLLVLLILILLYCCMGDSQTSEPLLGIDDDVRENVMCYDEEGAGEEDMQAYDLSRLQKPVDPDEPDRAPPVHAAPTVHAAAYTMSPEPTPVRREELPRTAPEPMGAARAFVLPPGEQPTVGGFITVRKVEADGDPTAPPYDSVREYEYEGVGSSAGSMSSLATDSSGDQDYDYLNGYGPPFKRLADMYGGIEEDVSNA